MVSGKLNLLNAQGKREARLAPLLLNLRIILDAKLERRAKRPG
jgi:hypothetical protein